MFLAPPLPETFPNIDSGGENTRAICETCGNDYDKAFRIHMNGSEHVFDSFECAIQALAPTCNHCNTRVIGHGIEASGTVFCCAHCAERNGIDDAVDRVD